MNKLNKLSVLIGTLITSITFPLMAFGYSFHDYDSYSYDTDHSHSSYTYHPSYNYNIPHQSTVSYYEAGTYYNIQTPPQSNHYSSNIDNGNLVGNYINYPFPYHSSDRYNGYSYQSNGHYPGDLWRNIYPNKTTYILYDW